ncbi:MAG: hypothetical protein LBF42_01415 [Puniceicoccales bacterium]|jgi:hypothetical protein|nr:hypothetical protein [Puniceicoccales bacterium]
MDVNFALKLLLWLALIAILGIFAYKFYRYGTFSKPSASNRLGKSMVNMERACTFGDSINFYEFAKYAIREAMRLPQGKVGLALTLEDIKANLRNGAASEELESIISEIYTTAEQLEKNEDIEIDLKDKLEIYCGIIRQLNAAYGKQPNGQT